MVRLVVVCIAVGISLGSAGCRRGAAPAAGVVVDGQAASDATSGQAAALGLPGGLPIYPGAVPVASPSARHAGTSLVLESRETPQKVASFYKSRLLAGGWSLDGEMTVEGEYVLVASKQAHRASALVSDEQGTTRITLTVTRED